MVARSSRFVSRLSILEGQLIGVCSLLTSMRDLGSYPVRGRLFGQAANVRGSYSARVPRSSLARVHRVFVLHIVEEEAESQEDEQDDRREDRQQEEEGRVAENQTHNMCA